MNLDDDGQAFSSRSTTFDFTPIQYLSWSLSLDIIRPRDIRVVEQAIKWLDECNWDPGGNKEVP